MSIADLPYQESYPPSLLGLPGGGPSTGATAGIPGTWTPAGSTPPASQIDAIQGRPYTIKATPATAWTSGQYVQTQQAGAGGRITWSGIGWVGGAAPLAAGQRGAEPEVEAPEAQSGGGAEYGDEPPPEPPQRRRRPRS